VRSHRATVLRAGIRPDKAAAAWRLLADVSKPQRALIERLLFGPGERVSNLGSLLSEGLHLHTQARVSISRSEGSHVSTHGVHKVRVSMSQPRVSAK
jgi:hypothetical protein